MRVHSIIADLPVADLAAARRFYADYLGLTVEEFNLGWVARLTSPETGGCTPILRPRPRRQRAQHRRPQGLTPPPADGRPAGLGTMDCVLR
ncbi:VOC family protein [Enemella evansiae]|uniref:VOC family protein n=1 Tax=Enemella evansiae TaxID=2016499 RepID=UPI0010EBCF1A|nr:hypothetical protein [Enemella evansiae]TDO92760.1 hypothetical protein C8D81_0528 [Enemella evansiae]